MFIVLARIASEHSVLLYFFKQEIKWDSSIETEMVNIQIESILENSTICDIRREIPLRVYF